MTVTMKPETRNALSEVTRGVTSLVKPHGFRVEKTRYWIAPQELVRWELQMVMEPGYGEGVFRLEWGVRAPRVAELEELEDAPAAMHATVSGDAGSFAMRKRRMTFLCVAGGQVGVFTSLLWGLRPEPAEQLIQRIHGWIQGHMLPLFNALDSYASIADFLETYRSRYGKIFMHGDLDGQQLCTTAVLRALAGDKPAAEAALAKWKTLLGKPGSPSFDILIKSHESIASRLRRL